MCPLWELEGGLGRKWLITLGVARQIIRGCDCSLGSKSILGQDLRDRMYSLVDTLLCFNVVTVMCKTELAVKRCHLASPNKDSVALGEFYESRSEEAVIHVGYRA